MPLLTPGRSTAQSGFGAPGRDLDRDAQTGGRLGVDPGCGGGRAWARPRKTPARVNCGPQRGAAEAGPGRGQMEGSPPVCAQPRPGRGGAESCPGAWSRWGGRLGGSSPVTNQSGTQSRHPGPPPPRPLPPGPAPWCPGARGECAPWLPTAVGSRVGLVGAVSLPPASCVCASRQAQSLEASVSSRAHAQGHVGVLSCQPSVCSGSRLQFGLHSNSWSQAAERCPLARIDSGRPHSPGQARGLRAGSVAGAEPQLPMCEGGRR